MSRRTEQLNRIEQALARLEVTAAEHATFLRSQDTAIRAEIRDVRASADAAHAGVQALADMLPVAQAIPPAPPGPPSTVAPAADGGTEGESAAAVRRALKTLKPKGM